MSDPLRWVPPVMPASRRRVELTESEGRVLTGIVLGLGNAQVAVQLRLAEDTVKCYVRRLMAKTDARSRTHLASLAASNTVQFIVLPRYAPHD